jgi:hypothetical protein
VKGMPWMKLWIEDLDRDCSALSLQARGAWVWILFDLRNHGGSRSLSLAQWASVVRASEEQTAAVLDELIEQKICDSSVTEALPKRYLVTPGNKNITDLITITSRRILRETKIKDANSLRQARFKEKRKSNAAGNAKVTHIEAEAEADIEAEAGVGVCSSSGRRVVKSVQKVSAKSTHTHTAAADFILTDELREWSEALEPEIDPEAEAEKFRDYYASKGKTFSDLSAAFRTWFRIAIDRQQRARSPGPARRESVEEHNRRVFAELEAMDETAIRVMQGLDPDRGSG